MRFAVFASGFGSNLQAIINAVKKGKIKAELALVVSDNSKAYAIERAQKAKIPYIVINPRECSSPNVFDRRVLKHLYEHKIDFIVLAGFMRILGRYFITAYQNKILNIHPALLPAFKGAHSIDDAFNYGVRVSGVTVHLVDEKIDHGPIILQEAVSITPNDTKETFEKKIHRVEYKLYPKAINLFVRGRLKITGRKVVV